MTDWRPIGEAVCDGSQCALRFRDPLGPYESPGPFFLHDDGCWYQVDPPTRIRAVPTHFRVL